MAKLKNVVLPLTYNVSVVAWNPLA
jgi:hypothetical protein